jgi:hypothetical protein
VLFSAEVNSVFSTACSGVLFPGRTEYRFLFVSLGSSTIQLHDPHAHVQRLSSVVKMATVLEDCTTEEQSFVVQFFLWEEDLNAKNKC